MPASGQTLPYPIRAREFHPPFSATCTACPLTSRRRSTMLADDACIFFKKKEEPMPTVDDFFVALGRSETVFAGLQSVPFDSQTAAFRVGVYAPGQKFGVQGIALSNAGDTIDVPEFGPAGIYGAATTSPGMIGWSREND